jgi:hypothetical protein
MTMPSSSEATGTALVPSAKFRAYSSLMGGGGGTATALAITPHPAPLYTGNIPYGRQPMAGGKDGAGCIHLKKLRASAVKSFSRFAGISAAALAHM